MQKKVRNVPVIEDSCSAHFFKKINNVKLPESWERIFYDHVRTDEPFVCLFDATSFLEWNTQKISELVPKYEKDSDFISPFDQDKVTFPLSSESQSTRSLAESTEQAMRMLKAHQNPSAHHCKNTKFLLCDVNGGGNHGAGSRIVVVSRCITKAFLLGRVALLSQRDSDTKIGKINHGSLEIFRQLQPWSSCTLNDMDLSRKKEYTNVLHWSPKECGGSCKKTLLPLQYSDLGLLFWKSIEIAYVMRPKEEIIKEVRRLLSMLRWTSPRVAVHVRRTDKYRGGWYYDGKPDPSNPPEADFIPLASNFQTITKYLERPQDGKYKKMDMLIVSDDNSGFLGIEKQSWPIFNFLNYSHAPDRVFGSYSEGNARKLIIDIMILSRADHLTVQGSSCVGMIALLIKLVREQFCSNFQLNDPNGGSGGPGRNRGITDSRFYVNDNFPSILELAAFCNYINKDIVHGGVVVNRSKVFASCDLSIERDKFRRHEYRGSKDYYVSSRCVHEQRKSS